MDLEGDQEEHDLEDNLAPDALGESSATFKGKDVLKKRLICTYFWLEMEPVLFANFCPNTKFFFHYFSA